MTARNTPDAPAHASREARGHAWGNWGPVFIVLAILCLLVGAFLLDIAAPQQANLFDKRWDFAVRASWDEDTARAGATMVAASAVSALIGLLVRALVGRGASDRAAQTLLVLGLIAGLAAAYVWTQVPLG